MYTIGHAIKIDASRFSEIIVFVSLRLQIKPVNCRFKNASKSKISKIYEMDSITIWNTMNFFKPKINNQNCQMH